MSEQIKVELQDFFGNDNSIADAAWTSSLDYQKKKNRTQEDIKRVVNMLADSKHSVPFESVVLRFWFRTSISCDRQIMTHRIASHSGMSGRYRTMPSDFLEVPEDVNDILKKYTNNAFDNYKESCEQANLDYQSILKSAKIAERYNEISNKEYKRIREFFRGMLPQHNMTERVSIFNLRSFANFVKLRDKEEAQPEIRDLAQKMLDAVKKANVAPIAIEALERNNWII